MADIEKVIKGLENTEIMLKQAVDRGGEMAVMGAFKCYNHVSDALALLKEQETELRELHSDVVELTGELGASVRVVRCKDCKHRYKKTCGYFYADGRIMDDDWFCADGEKKE